MSTVTKIGIDGPNFVMAPYFVANYVNPLIETLRLHRVVEFHIFDRLGIGEFAYEFISLMSSESKVFIYTTTSTSGISSCFKPQHFASGLHQFVHCSSDADAKARVVATVERMIEFEIKIHYSPVTPWQPRPNDLDLNDPEIRKIAATMARTGCENLWPEPWNTLTRTPATDQSPANDNRSAESRWPSSSQEEQECTTFDDPPTPLRVKVHKPTQSRSAEKTVTETSSLKSNKRPIDLVSSDQEDEAVPDCDFDVDVIVEPYQGGNSSDDSNFAVSVPTNQTTSAVQKKARNSKDSKDHADVSKSTNRPTKYNRVAKGKSVEGAPRDWGELAEHTAVLVIRNENGDDSPNVGDAAKATLAILKNLTPDLTTQFNALARADADDPLSSVRTMRIFTDFTHATSDDAIDLDALNSLGTHSRWSVIQRFRDAISDLGLNPKLPSAQHFADLIAKCRDGDGKDKLTIRSKKFQYMVGVGMMINAFGHPQDKKRWLTSVGVAVARGRVNIKSTPKNRMVIAKTLLSYAKLARRLANHPLLFKVAMNGKMRSSISSLDQASDEEFNIAAVFANRAIMNLYMWHKTSK